MAWDQDTQTAVQVSVDPSGLVVVTAVNVQAALAELDAAVAARLTAAQHDGLDHSDALASAVLEDLGNVAAGAVAGDALTFDGTVWGGGTVSATADILLSDDDPPQPVSDDNDEEWVSGD